jgi:endonuclease YncB( thermonuclease family)
VRLERTSGRAGRNAGAYVWTEDGVLLNALMLREGLAQLSTSGRVARADELAAAEADARSARRGIWSGGAGTARQPDAVIRKGRGGTRKPPARNSGQLTPNLVSCQLTTSSRSVCA